MKKQLNYLFLIALSFFYNPLFAQTGPGGVGQSTSNGLWLKADALNIANGMGVSQWLDSSGNSNDANQTEQVARPLFNSVSTFNNYPSLSFDGLNDWLVVDDADILDGSSSIDIFAVFKPKGHGAQREVQTILAKRDSYHQTSANSAYAFFFWNKKLTVDVNTNNDRFDTGATSYSNDTNYLLSFDFDGSLPANSRTSISKNGEVLVVGKETSNRIYNSVNPLTIGDLNDGDNRYTKGEMAEIIHFNHKLNKAQKTIVHNYLSSKYNLPLEVNDFYTQDDSVNGDFDHHVAGIAIINGESHLDSQGSGVLRVNNPSNSGIGDDKYFFWGQDVMGSSYDFNTEILAGDENGNSY